MGGVLSAMFDFEHPTPSGALALLALIFLLVTGPTLALRWLMTRTLTSYRRWSKPVKDRLPTPRVWPTRGTCVMDDFRDRATIRDARLDRKKLRVLSLNMEHGKQMDAIIRQVDKLKPDILLLQEVDMCTTYSGGVDTGAEIARHLGFNYLFACEVVSKPRRSGVSGGCEGNAIITRFDMSNARALIVACQRLPHLPQHSSFHTHAKAVATLATPFGAMECYSVHLDPHECGVRARAAQFMEIMRDASALPRPLFTATHHTRRGQVVGHDGRPIKGRKGADDTNTNDAKTNDDTIADDNTEAPSSPSSSSSSSTSSIPVAPAGVPLQIIAGDFNTVCHGVARFNRRIASDTFSMFKTMGSSEAEWFQRNAVEVANREYKRSFADPFDKRSQAGITFSGFSGIYTGKLDWILLSEGLRCTSTRIGHDVNDKCSDHQWIVADIEAAPTTSS